MSRSRNESVKILLKSMIGKDYFAVMMMAYEIGEIKCISTR